MPTFLLLFFLIYATWQLYFFIKLQRATSLSPALRTLVVFFLLLTPATPILVRLAEQAGLNTIAKPLAFYGYFWLAFIFLFVVSGITFDACRFALASIAQRLPALSVVGLNNSLVALLAPTVSAFFLCCYGFYAAQQIRTETVVIHTPKLSASHRPLRIAQISDVHLGLIVGRSRLAKILLAVEQARPDILVSTGDLVDGQLDGMETVAQMLAEVQPRYGKYAVTGNHEYYAGISQSLTFTERAGFTLLHSEIIRLDGLITIAGVDDRGRRPTANPATSPPIEQKLLSGRDPSVFTLLLKHRPEVSTDSQGLFDLQLSGHTHKGQIFPFSVLTKLFFITDNGLLPLAEQSLLYVSRGSGTWGPPIRLLSPPEITVIELRHSLTPSVTVGNPALDSIAQEK